MWAYTRSYNMYVGLSPSDFKGGDTEQKATEKWYRVISLRALLYYGIMINDVMYFSNFLTPTHPW